MAAKYKYAVENIKTGEIVSRHWTLAGAMIGLGNAGGFKTHQVVDLV